MTNSNKITQCAQVIVLNCFHTKRVSLYEYTYTLYIYIYIHNLSSTNTKRRCGVRVPINGRHVTL